MRLFKKYADLRARINELDEEVASLSNKVSVTERSNDKLLGTLHQEVFDTKVAVAKTDIWGWLSGDSYSPTTDAPTLAGKVDAIIEHLGITVDVKPEEYTESKVVAKKVKTTKKKGRK